MKKFIVLNKKVGETPLSAIHTWKKQNPQYADVSTSYAGRLDPMASGKLLVLLGDECKRQSSYTGLDKEYEIEVLLDIDSDTGDVLGMPKYANQKTKPDKRVLAEALSRERGSYMRAYPAFSSKTVNGKPLFLHALEGGLKNIEVPEHIERIYNIKHLSSHNLSNLELAEKVSGLLDLVPRTDEPSKRLGEDFRVDNIRSQWKSLFETVQERNYTVLRLRVICGSGTYMRSLASRVGKSLGTSALALSIRRTKIGKYTMLFNSIGFWTKTY